MKRIGMLRALSFSVLALLFAAVISYTTAGAFLHKANALSIPPLLKPSTTAKNITEYTLTADVGKTEFKKGVALRSLGYNGNILGPTIRLRRGERVAIRVKNRLKEETTVHWHGMLVPGEADGGPHQRIKPGASWKAEFTVKQQALTAWYHPHGLETTGKQVYFGLAGMMIVDDDISDRLLLPNRYGVDDIPLIVQDRRFTRDGSLSYLGSMRDIMDGMMGNRVIVNGTLEPQLMVERGLYRFRILNGSNARVYDFTFSDKRKFYLVASDGGFIEKPLELQSILLSPGERAEIVVDFSDLKKSKKLSLDSGSATILSLISTGVTKAGASTLPEVLTSIEKPRYSDVSVRRNFLLEGMGHMVAINGRQMDIDRIDETVKLNATEIWRVQSSSGGMGMMRRSTAHNFHAHGVQFLIVSRNGRAPHEYELGWKDTVYLGESDRVELIMRFMYKGVFMYHCHVLEHEDSGMMGQFEVR